MQFNKNTLPDMIAKIRAIKSAAPPAPQPETIAMINGTVATLYHLSLGHLLQWANDEYFDNDPFKIFIVGPAAQGSALYQFITDKGAFAYTGSTNTGISRPLEHITGGPRCNKALYAHLMNIKRSQLINYKLIYYSLTLSPTLPVEYKESTVLIAEKTLIQRNPTLINIQHN